MSQHQQQGRTKKKEEDPDAFMRLVSLRCMTLTCGANDPANMQARVTKKSQDVSVTSVSLSAQPTCRIQSRSTFKWFSNT
jgi:hypothetical protein